MLLLLLLFVFLYHYSHKETEDNKQSQMGVRVRSTVDTASSKYTVESERVEREIQLGEFVVVHFVVVSVNKVGDDSVTGRVSILYQLGPAKRSGSR